ncbi:ATPase AAA-type core [Trinorchestia longiramus]|nr:ATPase AAA-type core [Trinorchestia longiramus]
MADHSKACSGKPVKKSVLRKAEGNPPKKFVSWKSSSSDSSSDDVDNHNFNCRTKTKLGSWKKLPSQLKSKETSTVSNVFSIMMKKKEKVPHDGKQDTEAGADEADGEGAFPSEVPDAISNKANKENIDKNVTEAQTLGYGYTKEDTSCDESKLSQKTKPEDESRGMLVRDARKLEFLTASESSTMKAQEKKEILLNSEANRKSSDDKNGRSRLNSKTSTVLPSIKADADAAQCITPVSEGQSVLLRKTAGSSCKNNAFLMLMSSSKHLCDASEEEKDTENFEMPKKTIEHFFSAGHEKKCNILENQRIVSCSPENCANDKVELIEPVNLGEKKMKKPAKKQKRKVFSGRELKNRMNRNVADDSDGSDSVGEIFFSDDEEVAEKSSGICKSLLKTKKNSKKFTLKFKSMPELKRNPNQTKIRVNENGFSKFSQKDQYELQKETANSLEKTRPLLGEELGISEFSESNNRKFNDSCSEKRCLGGSDISKKKNTTLEAQQDPEEIEEIINCSSSDNESLNKPIINQGKSSSKVSYRGNNGIDCEKNIKDYFKKGVLKSTLDDHPNTNKAVDGLVDISTDFIEENNEKVDNQEKLASILAVENCKENTSAQNLECKAANGPRLSVGSLCSSDGDLDCLTTKMHLLTQKHKQNKLHLRESSEEEGSLEQLTQKMHKLTKEAKKKKVMRPIKFVKRSKLSRKGKKSGVHKQDADLDHMFKRDYDKDGVTCKSMHRDWIEDSFTSHSNGNEDFQSITGRTDKENNLEGRISDEAVDVSPELTINKFFKKMTKSELDGMRNKSSVTVVVEVHSPLVKNSDSDIVDELGRKCSPKAKKSNPHTDKKPSVLPVVSKAKIVQELVDDLDKIEVVETIVWDETKHCRVDVVHPSSMCGGMDTTNIKAAVESSNLDEHLSSICGSMDNTSLDLLAKNKNYNSNINTNSTQQDGSCSSGKEPNSENACNVDACGRPESNIQNCQSSNAEALSGVADKSTEKEQSQEMHDGILNPREEDDTSSLKKVRAAALVFDGDVASHQGCKNISKQRKELSKNDVCITDTPADGNAQRQNSKISKKKEKDNTMQDGNAVECDMDVEHNTNSTVETGGDGSGSSDEDYKNKDDETTTEEEDSDDYDSHMKKKKKKRKKRMVKANKKKVGKCVSHVGISKFFTVTPKTVVENNSKNSDSSAASVLLTSSIVTAEAISSTDTRVHSKLSMKRNKVCFVPQEVVCATTSQEKHEAKNQSKDLKVSEDKEVILSQSPLENIVNKDQNNTGSESVPKKSCRKVQLKNTCLTSVKKDPKEYVAVASTSKSATVASTSKSATVDSTSKSATVDSTSKSATVASTSKSTTVASTSKSATVASTSKSATVASTSKSTTVASTSKSTTVASTSKSTTVASTSKSQRRTRSVRRVLNYYEMVNAIDDVIPLSPGKDDSVTDGDYCPNSRRMSAKKSSRCSAKKDGGNAAQAKQKFKPKALKKDFQESFVDEKERVLSGKEDEVDFEQEYFVVDYEEKKKFDDEESTEKINSGKHGALKEKCVGEIDVEDAMAGVGVDVAMDVDVPTSDSDKEDVVTEEIELIMISSPQKSPLKGKGIQLKINFPFKGASRSECPQLLDELLSESPIKQSKSSLSVRSSRSKTFSSSSHKNEAETEKPADAPSLNSRTCRWRQNPKISSENDSSAENVDDSPESECISTEKLNKKVLCDNKEEKKERIGLRKQRRLSASCVNYCEKKERNTKKQRLDSGNSCQDSDSDVDTQEVCSRTKKKKITHMKSEKDGQLAPMFSCQPAAIDTLAPPEADGDDVQVVEHQPTPQPLLPLWWVVATWLVLLPHGWCCCHMAGVVATWLVLLPHGWYCCHMAGVVATCLVLLPHAKSFNPFKTRLNCLTSLECACVIDTLTLDGMELEEQAKKQNEFRVQQPITGRSLKTQPMANKSYSSRKSCPFTASFSDTSNPITVLDDISLCKILMQLQKDNPKFPVVKIFVQYLECKRRAVEFYRTETCKLNQTSEEALTDDSIIEVEVLEPQNTPVTRDVSLAASNKRKRGSRQSSDENMPVRKRRKRRDSTTVMKASSAAGSLDKEDQGAKALEMELTNAKTGATDGGVQEGGVEDSPAHVCRAYVPSVWCDVFAPTAAEHIIANEGAVTDLRLWLERWKQKCQDQQNNAFNLTPKRSRKRRNTRPLTPSRTGRLTQESDRPSNHAGRPALDADWTPTYTSRLARDSDWTSDYSYDSDDSSYGNTARPTFDNAVLLIGPSGCGKTAIVYALAQQLGYQVLEVNASSRRTSKTVSSRLMEATQSQSFKQTQVVWCGVSYFLTSAQSHELLAAQSIASPPPKKLNPIAAMFSKLTATTALKTEATSVHSSMSSERSAKSVSQSSVTESQYSKTEIKLKKTATQVSKTEIKSCKTQQPKSRGRKSKLQGAKKLKKQKSSSSDDFEPEIRTEMIESTCVQREKVVKEKKASSSANTTHTTSINTKKEYSLVLLEDIDVVFPDKDDGFVSSVNSLLTMSKRPTVITSSDVTISSSLLRHHHRVVHLVKPDVTTLS